MFNKFKSAIFNVVGSLDAVEGETNNTYGSQRTNSSSRNSSQQSNNKGGNEKTVKFPYSRPEFLQFTSEDEISLTADHVIRPIICPRDITKMPWNAGYAETINAGKSKRNEDQASIHIGSLTRILKPQKNSKTVLGIPVKTGSKYGKNHEQNREPVNGTCSSSNGETSTEMMNGTSEVDENKSAENGFRDESTLTYPPERKITVPYYFFGVFDGHAGWGAAVCASSLLHEVLHEKLCDALELIIPDSVSNSDLCGPLWSTEKEITPETAIIGAIERAFWTMDQLIAEDKQRHSLQGGCTACVALFILGKLFVSNAGDSRATIAHSSVPVPMSFDFTPESETHRIRKLGARHPELLGGEFTHLEFQRRPLRSDLGKKAPYRDHYMRGWALKTITERDLKYPLVCGEGKRSRVLATIGVTRGFGDHDLRAQFSGVPIKPFLSPEPEVRVFDLTTTEVGDTDVLILGTDGLWDITSNEEAVRVVSASLQQFPSHDVNRYKYRYMSAAHDLVLHSRGRLKEHNWRTTDDKHATIDDISVFVIPLRPYKEECEREEQEHFEVGSVAHSGQSTFGHPSQLNGVSMEATVLSSVKESLNNQDLVVHSDSKVDQPSSQGSRRNIEVPMETTNISSTKESLRGEDFVVQSDAKVVQPSSQDPGANSEVPTQVSENGEDQDTSTVMEEETEVKETESEEHSASMEMET